MRLASAKLPWKLGVKPCLEPSCPGTRALPFAKLDSFTERQDHLARHGRGHYDGWGQETMPNGERI